MNPKTLETQDLITIEAKAGEVLSQTLPQSHLYQMASRLQNILRLEMIRRGIFERQIQRLREASQAR
nr:hypothetical protein [uncultured Deefgea sp.]